MVARWRPTSRATSTRGCWPRAPPSRPKGAGQYFTPRELIKAIVDCDAARRPTTPYATRPAARAGFSWPPTSTWCEHHGKDLDPDQKKHLRKSFVHGWELVPNTARLCIMNLYLHGIDADPCPVRSRRGQPGQRPRRPVQPGADQSAVRQEEQHRHRQRGGRPGEGGHSLRAAGLLDDDEEQAAELPPARQDAAEDQRPLRHRRARQRAVRGRGRARPCGATCSSSSTSTRCCGCRPASSTPRG